MVQVKNKSVIGSLFWKFMEQGGISLMSFVMNIILARLLDPEAYGIVGLITVFITVSTVFINGGFSNALIQKKEPKSIDYSSVFYLSFLVSTLCYGVIFVVAPHIAQFYNEPILAPILRVQAISLFFAAYTAVATAKFQKELRFKALFKRTLITIIFASAIGVYMAYKGFGVWALVGYSLAQGILNAVVLFITERWYPKLEFSFDRIKTLFSFGYKLLISNLIDTLYNNIYSLVIGKVYTKSDLGYYNKGKNFPNMIIQNLNTSIQSVLLPIMSRVLDDKQQLKAMTRRSITVSCFIIFPAMAGLAGISIPLVTLLLKEKWLPCVPFLCFCCFNYAFTPVNAANLQAINAMGRSDIFLKLEVIKKIIGISTLILTIPYGLYTMLFARCITTAVISLFLNAFPNRKLLDYSPLEQIKDIFPSALLSIFMCGVVWSINLLNLNSVITLIIQVIVGVVIYVAGAKLFKFEAFDYVMGIIKGYKKRK